MPSLKYHCNDSRTIARRDDDHDRCDDDSSGPSADRITNALTKRCREPHHPTVDLARMDAKGLEELRARDAFLYYSIPEVRAAHLAGKEVEMPTTASVERSTRLSVECHPDLIMQELLELESSSEDEDDSDFLGLDDPLDFLFEKMGLRVRDEQ